MVEGEQWVAISLKVFNQKKKSIPFPGIGRHLSHGSFISCLQEKGDQSLLLAPADFLKVPLAQNHQYSQVVLWDGLS